MNSIFIYGASGHAKVVIDIIELLTQWKIHVLLDDDPNKFGKQFYGYSNVGGKEELKNLKTREQIAHGFIAIGDNTKRSEITILCEREGFELRTAIHPSAQIGKSVEIRSGTVIMAGVVVNADAEIGESSIVNTKSSIDHDCVIGSFVHIAVGARLCGNVKVNDFTLVGAGAIVNPNLHIENNVIIGSGATVVNHISKNQTVMGTPAKPAICY